MPLISKEYAILPIQYYQRLSEPHTPVYAIFHVVDELPPHMIIGTDIMREMNITIALGHPDTLKFSADNTEITIPLTRSNSPRTSMSPPCRRRIPVRVATSTIIPPTRELIVPVTHPPLPATDSYRLYFEPLHLHRPGSHISAAKGLSTDVQISALPIANLGATDTKLPADMIVGHITLLPHDTPVATFHTQSPQIQNRPQTPQDNAEPPNLPFQLNYEEDTPNFSPDVSEHYGKEYKKKVLKILSSLRALFSPKLGKVKGFEMPIPFVDENDLKGLKQNPFNISLRDKEAMDPILDELQQAGRIENVPFQNPSPAASPAFIVWRNGKPRVVIDLRRINTRLRPNAYPLPRQDTILSSLGDAVVFSTLDITKGFYQVPIRTKDRWKTAFVTPHRGHQQLTVSSMGLASSPGFFQNMMETILRKFLWSSLLVYIDDIVIFSKSLNQHLSDLQAILSCLEASGLTLSIKKCHFAYSSVSLLGHKVSRLGLSTHESKVEAIRKLSFPKTLHQLETSLGLFGYYREFVAHYAHKVEPLQIWKTQGFHQAPFKGNPRKKWAKKEIASTEELQQCWQKIKNELCDSPILKFPNFYKEFIAYVDGSKDGMGAAIHQKDNDGRERSVLFLSRTLKGSEKNYGSTELETAALVWAAGPGLYIW
ncbi:predicted protein [Histoplasma mississippiense (nom. inval.)]|uniref:predicted protein n=1 Tax=Ajellomyces capsulatus (strain NAm1 / WU24) TaxID=2059318 RepID=UPI000157D394|nr:predicted protein [Histoplasma mississippiense (nom. inval.)]EDN04528.1 predicted protein [Histoplasma mississippiense (nom. inval.)]